MNILNKLTIGTLPYIPKPIVRKFAARYIAGESLEDAIRVVKALNAEGACATLDVLGEDVHQPEDAQRALREALAALDAIATHKLDSNFSVKLTQLGLKIDREFCLNNLRALVSAARDHRNFVRVDMEDSSCTTDTIEVYRALRNEGFTNVGICLQAYLKRSETDLRDLATLRTSFRLCKGIYVEPPEIAIKGHDAINANFLRLIRIAFESGCYVGIATHDDAVVEGAKKIIKELNLKKTDYEFQMLLGVRWGLRKALIAEGHKLRVYVPFGRDWHNYSMRRFKENPKIAGYVVKSIFSKDRQ